MDFKPILPQRASSTWDACSCSVVRCGKALYLSLHVGCGVLERLGWPTEGFLASIEEAPDALRLSRTTRNGLNVMTFQRRGRASSNAHYVESRPSYSRFRLFVVSPEDGRIPLRWVQDGDALVLRMELP